MRHFILTIAVFIPAISFTQTQQIIGVYSSMLPRYQVKFNSDSTFEYTTKEMHPTFFRWEDFSEKGSWAISGDTITLNPDLQKKPFVESNFIEEENGGNEKLFLTFNHIKRWFDVNGEVIKTDTLQIDQLDYSFNKLKKRNRTRVSPHRSNNCTFAGYIPKEIITTSHTIAIERPAQIINSICIGCYELQGTKEFVVTNRDANHFTLNVYSNYYQDGQIRQMKFLVKNDKYIYTRQKANGKFEKDTIWRATENKIKKQQPAG